MRRAAYSAEQIKVDFLTTLSGPDGALGADIRDGFALALSIRDDQTSPEEDGPFAAPGAADAATQSMSKRSYTKRPRLFLSMGGIRGTVEFHS